MQLFGCLRPSAVAPEYNKEETRGHGLEDTGATKPSDMQPRRLANCKDSENSSMDSSLGVCTHADFACADDQQGQSPAAETAALRRPSMMDRINSSVTAVVSRTLSNMPSAFRRQFVRFSQPEDAGHSPARPSSRAADTGASPGTCSSAPQTSASSLAGEARRSMGSRPCSGVRRSLTASMSRLQQYANRSITPTRGILKKDSRKSSSGAPEPEPSTAAQDTSADRALVKPKELMPIMAPMSQELAPLPTPQFDACPLPSPPLERHSSQARR